MQLSEAAYSPYISTSSCFPPKYSISRLQPRARNSKESSDSTQHRAKRVEGGGIMSVYRRVGVPQPRGPSHRRNQKGKSSGQHLILGSTPKAYRRQNKATRVLLRISFEFSARELGVMFLGNKVVAARPRVPSAARATQDSHWSRTPRVTIRITIIDKVSTKQ
jgi:hypothetical protein